MNRVGIVGGLLAVALAIGCGPDPSDPAFKDDALKPVPELLPCYGCEAAPEEEITPPLAPAPRVYAMPDWLMFYGDWAATDGLAPQVVTITNTTTSAILISSVYVVDDESKGSGQGGGDYFEVGTCDLEAPLMQGDTIDVEVSFMRTSEQRSALLVVETTHPSFSSLVINLSGKYFIGDGGW